jgi:hypothetical protein
MIKREWKGGKGETSIKHLFPGRPSSSNAEAVGEYRLLYGKGNSEGVLTLPHRTNTKYIFLLCGEFCHNRELRYHCIVCSGWVHVECSSAHAAVDVKSNFCV